MEFTHRTQTQLSYDEAIERVNATLKQHGFGVLTRIDMRQTLQEKIGMDTPPQMILGDDTVDVMEARFGAVGIISVSGHQGNTPPPTVWSRRRSMN